MRFEDHLLSLDINIKQVFIRSKTASAISFEVKNNQNSSVFKTQKYAIQNEHSLVYEHCLLQINADFDNDTQVYTPQQITITLLLEQQAENSVGGFVKFNPFSASFQEKDWELPFESSLPDSKIIFTSRLQLVSKKQRLPQTKQSAASDHLLLKKSKNEGKESKRYSKKSSINEMILPDSKIKAKESVKTYRYKEFGGIPNKTKKLESARSANIEKGYMKATSPRFTEEATQKSKLVDEVEKLKKKIEEERVEKVRSISKLKMQINPKILQGDTHPPDSDVGKLKEKIRNLQRKQKNLQITIEDLTKDLERSKEKQGLLERRKEDLQRMIGEKDIKLRAANNTIRSLNEQIDSLSTRERIVSKKGEVKENIFKDQTKRLEERLKETELEVTEAINQKNETLKKISDLQKKYQTGLKERDLKFAEQKAKNLKLREELVSQQKDLEIKIEDLNLKNEEITKLNILSQERIHEFELSIVRYENQVAGLKESVKNQKENFAKLQAEYEKNEGLELSAIKKRNYELNTENNSLKEKTKKCEKELEDTELRLKKSEENLKAKTIQSQKHMSRLNNFQKDLDTAKEEVSRKVAELEYSKSTINSLNGKIMDLRDKLQNEKNRREDSNYELERTSSLFKQQITSLEAQISELKWTIIKNNDIVSDLQQKVRSSNDGELKFSEEIMAKSQRIASLEENNKILTLENDHLTKEKNSLTFKAREGVELLKQKNSEFEEEKKVRLRLQQKYEEEKQKANQLQLSNKNRETQKQKELKEKEQQLKHKMEEYQTVQMQLFKKNEEVLTLKANNQMILREMQLTKKEYDGVKAELNLLQADHTSLKDQLTDLKAKIEGLQKQLTTAKETLVMNQNKIKSLQTEHEEYIEGVRGSFQNLVGELFKQQTNWNVIATTLIPFPDQQLSSLQVKLVQKRNTFMIKQKQLNTSHEHQITSLQDQIKDMKIMFESRESEFKKHEDEEREKLKGLLYEGMLEKNNIVEEVNSLTQEKEEVLREMERFKREIIRREQNEEELNGQLQILLLEHDSLKAENQDLSNLIFKYREQEIRIRGEYEQIISELRQESSKTSQKTKSELVDREKKIISSQKQIMQLEQKSKSTESERQKLKEDLETALDRLKNAENKIIYNESQLTKLNNAIRSHEKAEAQLKEQIEKLENEIRNYSFREESFNGNITSLQTDLMQASIEKEKLNSDIQHLRERLEETQKIFSAKGESSKQKMQKKMEENAELKSKLIQKESQLSMKEFVLKQKEMQINNFISEKEELKQSITDLKSRVKELNQAKDLSDLKIREHTREIQRLEMDALKTEDMLTKSNYTIMAMQTQLDLMRAIQATLKEKEEQCIKLREQKAETDQNFIWQMKKYQQNVTLLKRQLEAERSHHKSIKEQHKINISRTESSNNEKYNNLLFELQQEKDQFQKRVLEIEAHNKALITDLENKIESLREELADQQDHERMLQQELVKRQIDITNLKKKLKETEKNYEDFKQRYNRYYLMYEESKTQIQGLIKSNEQKLKAVTNQLKYNFTRVFNQKLSELSKNIERRKYLIETNAKNETFTKREYLQEFNQLFSKIREYILEMEIKESELSVIQKERGEQ